MKKSVALLAIFALVFSPVTPSFAATWYFKEGGDSYWSTATNWWSNAAGTGDHPTEAPWISSGSYEGYDLALATGGTSVTNAGGTIGGGLPITGACSVAVTNEHFSSIGGGNFSGAVTNNGAIYGGTFSGTITNNVNISGGAFSGSVTNDGYVAGGTFNGAVTGTGYVDIPDGYTLNGTGLFSNSLSSFTIASGGMVSGSLTIDSDVTNDGTITGGTFNSVVRGGGR